VPGETILLRNGRFGGEKRIPGSRGRNEFPKRETGVATEKNMALWQQGGGERTKGGKGLKNRRKANPHSTRKKKKTKQLLREKRESGDLAKKKRIKTKNLIKANEEKVLTTRSVRKRK